MDERKNCVSDREWKFRLRGYGYDVRDTTRGTVQYAALVHQRPTPTREEANYRGGSTRGRLSLSLNPAHLEKGKV
jgi:hypothetical protein